jgi:uncharacterized metal-binding protein
MLKNVVKDLNKHWDILGDVWVPVRVFRDLLNTVCFPTLGQKYSQRGWDVLEDVWVPYRVFGEIFKYFKVHTKVFRFTNAENDCKYKI